MSFIDEMFFLNFIDEIFIEMLRIIFQVLVSVTQLTKN